MFTLVRLTQKRQLHLLRYCLKLKYLYIGEELQGKLGLINKPCADAYAQLDSKYLVIEAKNTDIDTALVQLERTINKMRDMKWELNYGILIASSLSHAAMKYRETPNHILQVFRGHWENVVYRNVPILVVQHSKLLLGANSGYCKRFREIILHGGA